MEKDTKEYLKVAETVVPDYFGKKGVAHLQSYHYTGTDSSILAPIFYYFWRPMIRILDTRLSPCIYSTVGLGFGILGYLCVWWTCPNLDCFSHFPSDSNSIAFAFAALGLFLYQTFDALDGLQCKKVDMYHSPMAELFDHMCDSITTVLYGLTVPSALSLGPSHITVILLISSFIGFFAPTWEHLHVGVMRFQPGPVNPTEALLMTQLMLLVTAYHPYFWSTQLIGGLAIKHVVVLATVLASTFSMISSINAVVANCRAKNKDMWTPLRELSMPITITVAGLLWLCVGTVPEMYLKHPRITLMTLSLPFLYTISHMIVAEVTKSALNLPSILKAHIPLILNVLVKFIPVLNEMQVAVMWLSFAFSAVQYVIWIKNVINSFSYHLGMKHWHSIPPFHPPAVHAQ
jgi:ethanolaminephosphotransferase